MTVKFTRRLPSSSVMPAGCRSFLMMLPRGDFATAGAADVVVVGAGVIASTEGEVGGFDAVVGALDGDPPQAVRVRPAAAIMAVLATYFR